MQWSGQVRREAEVRVLKMAEGVEALGRGLVGRHKNMEESAAQIIRDTGSLGGRRVRQR